MKNSRHSQANSGQGQECGRGGGSSAIKILSLVAAAAYNHGASQDQKEVPDDRAGNRGLHHINKIGPESGQSNNQFAGIAKSGVEKGSGASSYAVTKDLGSFAHQAGKRHYPQAGGEKNYHRR